MKLSHKQAETAIKHGIGFSADFEKNDKSRKDRSKPRTWTLATVGLFFSCDLNFGADLMHFSFTRT